jgi:hypothetical protein
MRPNLPGVVVLLAILSTTSVFGEDQQKAAKQIRRITAMAADVTARGIVSRTISDILKIKRDQLMRERRAMNLNYGSLFLAHELTAKGTRMLDVALQLQASKSIFEIANQQNVDWKQVAADAKRLNSKVEDNIYNHFLHAKADKDRDIAESYDATLDWVNADADVTQQDLREAQETYVLWRDHAAEIGGKGSRVSSLDELASHKIEEQAHEVRIPAPTSSTH